LVCLKVAEMVNIMGGRKVASVREWKSGELSKLGKWVIGIWCGEMLGGYAICSDWLKEKTCS